MNEGKQRKYCTCSLTLAMSLDCTKDWTWSSGDHSLQFLQAY